MPIRKRKECIQKRTKKEEVKSEWGTKGKRAEDRNGETSSKKCSARRVRMVSLWMRSMSAASARRRVHTPADDSGCAHSTASAHGGGTHTHHTLSMCTPPLRLPLHFHPPLRLYHPLLCISLSLH